MWIEKRWRVSCRRCWLEDVADWWGHLSIVACGMGWNLRRYFLLPNVSLPVPSTLTAYWSLPLTWTTRPVLSHLRGKRPVWFWMWQWSPSSRGDRCFAFFWRFSDCFVSLVRRVSSHLTHMSRHIGRTDVLLNICDCGWKSDESRKGRPKMIWAGEIPLLMSGVLRNCRMALVNLSVSSSRGKRCPITGVSWI